MKMEYISSSGESLNLLQGKNYVMTNFDSQTSAATDISSVILGGYDGDSVNNIQAQPRTIIIDLRILNEVEATKRELLHIIKLKQQGRIRWEQDSKIIDIQGYIEAVEMPRWNNAVIMQITMHCAQPFWEDISSVSADINEFINLHYFTQYRNDMLIFTEDGQPFGEYDITRTRHINNAGDVAVGLEIEINAFAQVTNPIIYAADGTFFGVGHGSGNKQVIMQAGDIIKITTGKNNKAVTLNGVSLLGKIKPKSTWLQLAAGANTFSIDSEEGSVSNMAYSLSFKRRYV